MLIEFTGEPFELIAIGMAVVWIVGLYLATRLMRAGKLEDTARQEAYDVWEKEKAFEANSAKEKT